MLLPTGRQVKTLQQENDQKAVLASGDEDGSWQFYWQEFLFYSSA